MKEVVRVRAPVSMDALVQQTESPFTTEVLHFPLPTKFIMPQIEAFDGMKDLVDHRNTYKNQMELHGYYGPYPIHGPARLAFKWKENVKRKCGLIFEFWKIRP